MKTAKNHNAVCGRMVYLLAAIVVFASQARGQTEVVVQEPAVEIALDRAYSAMYNLNFEVAFQQADAAKAAAKDDPMPWVAESCAVLFREFERLNILRSELFASDETFDGREAHAWNPKAKAEFEVALNNGEKLAQQRLAHNQNDLRALFTLTLINGLRADDAALISKKNFSALSFTRTANSYAERLLSRDPDYYDAYLATGMGKYIIGGKAAPVRWLLRLGGLKGDREEGVRELKLAAEHGHYLAPFARILLSFDDLRKKDKAAARRRLAQLHEQFPNNPLFVQELAKLDHPSPTRH